MKGHFDIAIIGGGLVGASLACAFSGRGLDILMIEAHPLREPGQPSYDDRTLALADASCRILDEIGLWPGVKSGVTPIREVHVSAMGRFGTARIRAEDFNLPALGHVVEGRVIGQAVVERLKHTRDITMLAPAKLEGFEAGDEQVDLSISVDDQKESVTASVLVGADGADSFVRQSLGLEVLERDYRQTAVIANVTPEGDHAGRALERLTPTGPMALLPHQGSRVGSVWVTETAHAEDLLDASDEAFLEALQERCGYRLGRLTKLGKRASYPLRLVYCPEAVAGRCVLIGNAAHTIHPVGAQGFNLGLRDVANLVDVLAGQGFEAAAVPERLVGYQARRRRDQSRIVGFTDTLIDAFAIRSPLVAGLSSAAMIALDRIPPLKAAFARRTMGYGDPLPSLAEPSEA
ncbi:MAG: 2-octaprenyl-6-methoxyphenyl hydroxylase [Xanthomonadales bacterium]|nr:2-octaprenyl-6-methoxyphenyl hydroxylase [Xanthomonadales bacterium]